MTKNDCFSLGYISKKVGNEGEVVFIMDVDSPSRYKKLESVFIDINNSLVPFFIKKITLRENIATVSLDGIETIERAEELVKKGLYLPLSFLPPLKNKQFYFHEILNFAVIDKHYGEIGIVKGMLEFPQQAIFQIQKGDVEILIPAKEEFIISIDRTMKQIHIDAPEGLIDVYLKEDTTEEE